ncbi:structural maintenance of chromosomes protein 4 [Onthophagus taurus]|uniref:structural maintenance of chromosomes protein 4 n=1 Tax=Onthophagus taurus TaxID=166361 RepID=UPI0039BEA1B5
MPSSKEKDPYNMSIQQQGDESDEELHFSDEEGGCRIGDIYIPPPPRPALTTEDKGPRLIITKITNNWFKSYAGVVHVGPFHKRFNAVMGPNGSGKSNVIDSMLFVFGYRATKIRSKKLSGLIHNSDSYRNVQSCSVTVHFAQITDKEGDDYDIIPDSEFIVSRTVNKDNTSYYEVNGRRVQFKEVALLLRKYGIDLDNNRFLILQGEVEQISLMKPKAESESETGMLEYLEDIIGTGRYKEALEKLSEKHRDLSDKRNDKLNRCKMVETELNRLQAPMEEAVEYLKLENSITSCKNAIIQIEIHNSEMELVEKNTEKELVEAELQKIVNEVKDLEDEHITMKKSYNQAMKDYTTLEVATDKCKQVIEKLSIKDFEIQTQMEETNKNRKKWKKMLETEQKKRVELVSLPEKAETSIKELQVREQELLTNKAQLDEEKQEILASLKDSTKDLQEKRDALQDNLVQLRSKVDDAKSNFTIAESELNIFTSAADTEQEKLNSLKTTYENIKQTVIERKRNVESLKREIPDDEKRLNTAMRESENLTARQHELTSSRREKMASLESSKSAMQSSRSRGRVLDSLMQQKREGKCPGIYGRLGDLGAIDQKYDVAISTACGPLDNIVTDSVDTAEWCIEFLKKHDIGRASFIALDKQEHLRHAANTPINTPENVHRLYDLIKVQDDRVKTAFYFALRDTLVADNLDQASRIAYGARRFRVVTLMGELIETSGTMSGGGKKVSRGRMGQSVTAMDINPEEIERMTKNLQKIEEEFNSNRVRLTDLTQTIRELKPKVTEMKLNLNKHTIELDALKSQEPVILKQLNEQNRKMKDINLDANEVKRLTKKVEAAKVEYEEAERNAGKLQVKVDAISKEIKEKTTGRVQTVEKKIKDLMKTINLVQNQITKDKVVISTAPRDLKRCDEKLQTLENDIANSQKRLIEMKSEREVIEVDATKMTKHLEGLNQELLEKEENLEGLKKDTIALTQKENKLKGSKIEIDHKVKNVNKEVDHLEGQISTYKSVLKNLKCHIIPNQPTEELKTYTTEELGEKNVQNLKHEINSCKKALEKQQPNFAAIEDYKRSQSEYNSKMEDLKAVTEERNKITTAFEGLKTRRKNEFLTGLRIIRLKLREMYQTITLGGDADLEVIDSYDPFSEGVKLNVRPPKKPWKSITNLSGGEKTLTSLALVFALHYYKPSPFYVMDEIDAALDFKNVSIVAHYIKERTKNAQFIIISLRSNMFELGDYLVGIYKINDCTSSITLDVHGFEKQCAGNIVQNNGENMPNLLTEEESQNQEEDDADTITSSTGSLTGSLLNTVVPNSCSESMEEMDVE